MSDMSTLSAEQAYSDLLPRIKQLGELDGEPLGNSMKDLKAALLANPAAATLMLPEDVGEMVAALRRLTGQTIVAATKEKKAGAPKKKVLTAEELNAAFDEL